MAIDLRDLQKEIDEIYGIERNIPKNWFVKKGIIPLGTKRPFYEYENGKIPDDDLVYLPVDKTNVTNMLTIAPTGIGKTRLLKRLLGYYQLFGYNILTIDPKSYEYLIGGIKKGTGKRLHEYETNSKYKVKAFCPVFAKKHIYESETIRKHFNFYSPNIKSFTDVMLWRNLGVTDKSAQIVVSQILKKNFDLNSILNKILKNSNIHTITKRAVTSSITTLQDLGFFDKDYKEIDLQKEWAQGFIVAISYFSQQGVHTSTDIAKLVQQVRFIGNEELQKEKPITPKLINFDDALYYAIRDKSDDFNLAVREIKNAQNNYRSLGVNTNVIVQNPAFIDADIIDGATTKLIAGIENPESLRGLIPRGAFNLLYKRSLIEDESQYLFQQILVKGRRYYTTFFPLDVPYGHS